MKLMEIQIGRVSVEDCSLLYMSAPASTTFTYYWVKYSNPKHYHELEHNQLNTHYSYCKRFIKCS